MLSEFRIYNFVTDTHTDPRAGLTRSSDRTIPIHARTLGPACLPERRIWACTSRYSQAAIGCPASLGSLRVIIIPILPRSRPPSTHEVARLEPTSCCRPQSSTGHTCHGLNTQTPRLSSSKPAAAQAAFQPADTTLSSPARLAFARVPRTPHPGGGELMRS